MSKIKFLGAVLVIAACAASAFAEARVGWLEIKGGLAERPDPFAAFATTHDSLTMLEAVAALEEASEGRGLDAIVLRLKSPAFTIGQAEELGAAIRDASEAGTKVHLFTEIYSPAEVVLGSYCDEVIVQKGGAVSLPGLYMEEMYLADTLALVGVQADMVQVGDYKGASEPMSRTAPSREWDQNISGLLDGMYARLREAIKTGRDMTDAELDAAMEEAWLVDAARAVELGIADVALDRLDIDAHLRELYGDTQYSDDLVSAGREVDTSNPFAMFQMLMEPGAKPIRRDTIAVVHIDGAIVDGESESGGLFGGSSVGSLTIREALAEIEGNDLIRGVILRINSPGGSAIASESIWLGARRVADQKPVWTSVGDMAASGGYYAAVAGDRIFVNPSSIVGSIGVVGGKYTMGGLYATLRANVKPRARGPKADLFSTVQPWSAEQRALIRDRMTETYDQFVRRVRAGRSDVDIDQVAEGRLFTGVRAVELRMADDVGGLDAAVEEMAKSLGLRGGRYDVVSYPRPKSLAEAFESLLGGFGVSAPASVGAAAVKGGVAEALREVVGARSWPAVRDALEAVRLLRDEPVILALPRTLIFR